MPLTASAIQASKPRATAYKLSDAGGLFLLVNPNGSKWWRLKFRFEGKESALSFGVFPDVGLKEAREKRDAARKLLAAGVNPAEHRKAVKQARSDASANSFEAIALEWLAKNSAAWAVSHSSKIKRRLEKDLFPRLGSRPISEIEPPELLGVLERIEKRGAVETANRARGECGQIWAYAIAKGVAKRNPAVDIIGALARPDRQHFATITDPVEIGALLRAMRSYSGTLDTKVALTLAPLMFVRPGELRQMEWKDIDFDTKEWRPFITKIKRQLIVPLPVQAIVALREIEPLTARGRYVFPGQRDRKRPMSNNTVNAALRRMGYDTKTQITGHGFRAMARSLLAEQGWKTDAIERQLSHKASGPLGEAYDRAQYLPERQAMMQSWADYLDQLAGSTGKVVPIRSRAA